MSKISERLAAIRARCEAAIPAPWLWKVNPDSKSVNLVGGRHLYVMSFRRWGMGGAAPAFQTDGLLVRVDELMKVVPGLEHHARHHQTIAHPDAEFIAHARADVPALLAVAEAAERLLADLPGHPAGEKVMGWETARALDGALSLLDGAP